MATNTEHSVSFEDADSRHEDMHRRIESWIERLASLVDEAQATEEFRSWLDVQSRFHDYSYRNTLLIKQQYPSATKIAGFQTWQEEFDRHVKEGEQAIWIWAPIITSRCPACENGPSYHENSECEYDGTDPEDWAEGLVGFKPVPVFDVSQTDGASLPELDTEAIGSGAELVLALVEAADDLDLTVSIVEPDEWEYGDAEGVCTRRNLMSMQPLVEVRDRSNDADLATALVHEYAHARLHFDVDDRTERAKREVEAEAVAYVVGKYYGLDTSNSAVYLAAWQADASDVVQERLKRIRTVAAEFIDAIAKSGMHNSLQ